jgi:hypothetical protein
MTTNAEIYNQNAKAWIAMNGGREIHSGQKEHPKSESWDAWFHYFDKTVGHENMVRIMRAHEHRVWLGKGGVTVPTEWPIDFDETAAKFVTRYQPPTIEGLTDAQRAEVVRRAMVNAGFVPKALRHGKPVSAEDLIGEPRLRRLREIAAEEAHLAALRELSLPALSDTAKAIMHNRKGDDE